ncbi:MAG: Holliday junction resolvase RuvX [Candidatus Saganbacteria bacterium]|nr:Holliday junction resolvase RuvX [Candidatus Saganbacteria bacterium]
MILAIDPGTSKCGLAVLTKAGQVVARAVLARAELAGRLPGLLRQYDVSTLVIGLSAQGRRLAEELAALPGLPEISFITEKNSTLEARRLYWQENRPSGLWRLVPESLRPILVAIDDHAAVILGQRYLKT